MAMTSNTDKLVRSTVKLAVTGLDGTSWSGSGLLMALHIFGKTSDQFAGVVVTNRHVAEGAKTISYRIPSNNEQGFITIQSSSGTILHPNPDIDLACVPVPQQLFDKSVDAEREFISSKDIISSDAIHDLNAIENVIMIGYPDGLIDQKGLYPISRRGITATPPYADLDGDPQFMIDCACFPGSSGSPVFLLDQGIIVKKNNDVRLGEVRFGLLGFLFAGPVLNQQGKIVAQVPPPRLKDMVEVPLMMNLGICVRAERLYDMFDLIKNAAVAAP